MRPAVTVETVTRDTVYFPEIAEGGIEDTCLTYSDNWATFRLCAGREVRGEGLGCGVYPYALPQEVSVVAMAAVVLTE